MMPLGLSKAQNRALDKLLCSAHHIRISVALLDLNHVHKEYLTDNFLDGAVTVDADAEITRALDLTLLDPTGRINLEPDNPSRTSIYIADMIAIKYIVTDPLGTQRFEIPVFCGPIDDVERDRWILSVKCLGKEVLGASNAWEGKTYKEGQKRTEVIENLVKVQAGETRYRGVDRKAKLNGDLRLSKDRNAIHEAKKLARSMGLNLFWDGSGTAILRERRHAPLSPRLTSKWITSQPQISYDLSKTINAVRVIGKKRKGKPPIKARAVAPRRHSLSPWRLGRGTTPRYLWMEINDDSVTSKKEARSLARRLLKQGLLAGVEVQVNSLPHPRWQELDVVMVDVPGFTEKVLLKKFTIGLVAGDESSIGYLKRVRPRGGAVGARRKRKAHKGNKSKRKARK